MPKVYALPIEGLLIDNESEQAFWAPTEPNAPASEALCDEVIVDEAKELPATIGNLEEYIRTYMNHMASRRILNRLPDIARSFATAQANLDGDYFLPLEDHAVDSLCQLYEDVLALRTAVGLSADLLPWLLWCERSRTCFNDGYRLHWGVHDEIIGYLEPSLQEAICRAGELLDDEEYSLENQRVKNYFSEDNAQIEVRLDGVPWDDVEAVLDKLGVRKLEVKQ